MKAYSLDLRQKILRACDQRLGPQRAIATLFGVSQAFEQLIRWRQTTGDITPRPHAGGRLAISTMLRWLTCAVWSMRARMRRSPS